MNDGKKTGKIKTNKTSEKKSHRRSQNPLFFFFFFLEWNQYKDLISMNSKTAATIHTHTRTYKHCWHTFNQWFDHLVVATINLTRANKRKKPISSCFLGHHIILCRNVNDLYPYQKVFHLLFRSIFCLFVFLKNH